MRVCAHTPVRSSERRSHRQRTHRPAERHPAGPTDQNKQQNQASTAQPYAQKGSGGWATNEDTPRTVASALLSSVRGCHAGAFAVPMSKYSACKCPKGVLHVSRHLRRHPWQSRRRPPLISYARSNLRWTVPHAAQIIMLALKTTYVALSRHNLPHGERVQRSQTTSSGGSERSVWVMYTFSHFTT